MKRLLILLVIVLLVLGGCTPRAKDNEQVSTDEKIVLKFSHVASDDSPKGRAARRWASLVAQRSGGRVEIQVFPNSTLYKDGEELEALQKNYVQIIAPATSKLTKIDPIWQFLDLPYLFSNIYEVHQTLDGRVGKELMNYSTSMGLRVLAFWDNGFKVMAANRPLKQVKDFQGLSFRIMDSPVLVDQFNLLGANPIPIPFSDVYSALEQHQVDGSENTPSNLYSKRFYQLQKFITLSNHGYLGYALLFNNQEWDTLPKSIQGLLISTLDEVTKWERSDALKQNQIDLKRISLEKQAKVLKLSNNEIQSWKRRLDPLGQQLGVKRPSDLLDFIKREQDKESTS